MCTSGAVNMLFWVEILMYQISLTHSHLYMYRNDASNFIFTHHAVASQGLVVRWVFD